MTGIKRFLKFFLVLVLLFIVTMGIWFYWANKANSIHLKSNKVEIKAKNPINKKALIIYQKGRTKFAENIAKKLGEGISDSGYDVTINYPGDYMQDNLSEYSLILFGSSVYMSGYSKVLEEYINRIKDFGNGKLVIYTTGMLKEKLELDALETLFKGKKVDEKFKIVKSDSYEQEAYRKGLDLCK